MTESSSLLSGLRLVEMSTSLAGAHIGQLFADFGAEVIQIERPGGAQHRDHAGYPFVARGKRSIALDLKEPSDLAVARVLASGADVVVETFRPGVAQRLGVGYEELSRTNPGLVYASITGFGRTGPMSQTKGYEGLVFAKAGGGRVFSAGVDRSGPAFASVPYCSWSAGQTGLHAVLAALYERETSGLGQHVEADMLRSIAGQDPYSWLLHLLTEKYPDAFHAARPFTEDGPNSPLFAFVLIALSAEGEWLQFSQVGPHLFRALLHWLDLEWLLDDPAWAGAPVLSEQSQRNELWDLLLTAVRRRTVAEWREIFDQDRNVWAEVFRRGDQVLDHPQLIHDGQVLEVVDPSRGAIRQPGRLVRVKGQSFAGALAPALDADAAELRRRTPTIHRPEPRPEPAGRAAPLDGVTILELGIWFAGPYGATLLADLGARVIKVEPIEGDPLRWALPFPEAGGALVTQGKESVAVDISTAEGREIVYRLVAKCDVVLQSFRSGVAERLQVDCDSLRRINPELIYLNAPGYGTDGPCGDKPAFAPVIGAASGLARCNVGASLADGASLTLDEVKNDSVRMATVNYSSFASSDGLSAYGVGTSLLLGILARRRGQGAHELTATMLSTVSHVLVDDIIRYEDRPPPLLPDSELHGFSALYRLYEAAEGWIFLAAPTDREWSTLACALRADRDLAGQPAFASAELRRANDAELAAQLSAIFVTRSAAEWEQALGAADVGCVQVTEDLPEAYLQGEFGRETGLLVETTHPIFETYSRLGPLVGFSRSSVTPRSGCLLGEHVDEVLTELGYSKTEIDAFRDAKVVG